MTRTLIVMTGAWLIAACIPAQESHAAQPEIGHRSAGLPTQQDRNPLIGTWRFVTYVDTPEGGEPVRAFGKNPIGFFTFTADGHVFMNIMHNPPNPVDATADPDPDACVPGWYCAYFGTYTVNLKQRYWITHVVGSNMPTIIGTDQKRAFTLRGDTLVIAETYRVGDTSVKAERVLVRDVGVR
jgi:hypothetical protein